MELSRIHHLPTRLVKLLEHPQPRWICVSQDFHETQGTNEETKPSTRYKPLQKPTENSPQAEKGRLHDMPNLPAAPSIFRPSATRNSPPSSAASSQMKLGQRTNKTESPTKPLHYAHLSGSKMEKKTLAMLDIVLTGSFCLSKIRPTPPRTSNFTVGIGRLKLCIVL